MLRQTWLKNLQRKLSRTRRSVRKSKTSQSEGLENRVLLTISTGFNAATGELSVSTDAADSIVIDQSGGQVTVNGNGISVNASDVRELEVQGSAEANVIDLSNVSASSFANLQEVDIDGGGGNDTILGSQIADSIDSGAGDDVVLGMGGDDAVDGGDGNDLLLGSAGHDELNGGAGDDVLKGQGGSRDNLNGGAGNDTIDGGAGGDRVVGVADTDYELTDDQLIGEGVDTLISVEQANLSGGGSNNTINAQAFSGFSTLFGADGDDEILASQEGSYVLGGDGADNIVGSDNYDLIIGMGGNDNIHGNGGDDQLLGSGGRDLLDGGAGNDSLRGQGTSGDTLTGGAGDDTMDGGPGNDRFSESGDNDFSYTDNSVTGNGNDVLISVEMAEVLAGQSANTIDGSGFSGFSTISGGSGDDTIISSAGGSYVLGGDGNDNVTGSDNFDLILGDAGDDVINGNAGDDVIDGQEGNDDIDGGDGDDDLQGGDDDDQIDGGAGNDALNGGAGLDLLDGDEGDDTEEDGFAAETDEGLIATLSSMTGSATGSVEFEQSIDGDAEVELSIEVENAAPGTHNVLLAGVNIGVIEVLSDGTGKVEFSSNPDESSELSIPENLPAVIAGTPIEVEGIASGTFALESDVEVDDIEDETKIDDGGVVVVEDDETETTGMDSQSENTASNTPDPGQTFSTGDSAANESADSSTEMEDDTEDDDVGESDANELELSATLTGSGNETGEAEFETETENGVEVKEFEVEISGAAANTTFDITLNSTVVGQLTTDANGDAELTLSSSPDVDELPLPTGLVDPVTGDSISVGSILTGYFAVEVDDDDMEDDDNETGADMDTTTGMDSQGESTAANNSDNGSTTDSAEVELEATLTGSNGETGEVEFESEMENGVEVKEFEVEISGAAANTTLDITVNSTIVGQVTTDANGDGEVTFSSEPSTGESPLPAGFVDPVSGDSIAIGSILSGTFATAVDDDETDGDDDEDELELNAVLAGATPANGEAEFESEMENGVEVRELEVEIEGATPNSTFDIAINSVVIGQITSDASGEAEVIFSSSPDSDELSLPTNLLDPVFGDTITVGSILSGMFSDSDD